MQTESNRGCYDAAELEKYILVSHPRVHRILTVNSLLNEQIRENIEENFHRGGNAFRVSTRSFLRRCIVHTYAHVSPIESILLVSVHSRLCRRFVDCFSFVEKNSWKINIFLFSFSVVVAVFGVTRGVFTTESNDSWYFRTFQKFHSASVIALFAYSIRRLNYTRKNVNSARYTIANDIRSVSRHVFTFVYKSCIYVQ